MEIVCDPSKWMVANGYISLEVFIYYLRFLFSLCTQGMIWLLIFLFACTIAFANAGQLLFLPNTYVVEFQQRHQDDLFQHLTQHKIEYHLRHRYDMMNAISLSFNTPNDATRFFNLMRQDIHRTWPVVWNEI